MVHLLVACSKSRMRATCARLVSHDHHKPGHDDRRCRVDLAWAGRYDSAAVVAQQATIGVDK